MKNILLLILLFLCGVSAHAQTYKIYECTLLTEVNGKEVEKKDEKILPNGVLEFNNNVATIKANDYYEVLYCDPKTFTDASEGAQKVYLYNAIDSKGIDCDVMLISYKSAQMISVVYKYDDTIFHAMFFYK